MISVFSTIPNHTNSKWWRDAGLRRNVAAAVVLYFGTFSLGYDGSYLNALQSLETFNSYFGYPSGLRLSIIHAMPYVFMAAFSPFIGVLNDWLGRRFAVALSAVIIFIGALVGTFAKNTTTLVVGRAIAGPGGALALSSSALLVSEILHPRLRPVGSSVVVAWFYVGSIVSSWIGFAVVAANWASEWSWRLPTLLQVVGPIIILAFLPFVPESPRWQVAHGKANEAHRMLARHHANGKMDDGLVLFQLEEITTSIEREKQERTGYGAIIATTGNRKRLSIILLVGFGSQLNGVGLFSYYLSPVLQTVGVTSPLQQTAVNASLAIWNLGFAILGSCLVERVGRRPLWLVSTSGILLCFVVIIGLSGSFATSGSKSVGLASVPFIFLAFAFYDVAWSPLSGSYTVEILPYSIRANGMAIFSTAQCAGIVAGQWANPVGLEAITWRFYFVYLALLFILLVAIIFLFPETKGLSLEEVALVFDQPGGGSSEKRRDAVDSEFKQGGTTSIRVVSRFQSSEA